MDREPIEEFVKRLGITITSKKRTPARLWEKSEWEQKAHHWTVTLHRGDLTLTTPWSAGQDIPEAPTAADVMSCLQLDASAFRNTKDINDFAREYGDGVTVENTKEIRAAYKSCEAALTKLTAFLGAEDLEHLLRNVDSL